MQSLLAVSYLAIDGVLYCEEKNEILAREGRKLVCELNGRRRQRWFQDDRALLDTIEAVGVSLKLFNFIFSWRLVLEGQVRSQGT